MSGLGFERATQDRVLRLFQEQLGYRSLGDWNDRPGNSNIEEGFSAPIYAVAAAATPRSAARSISYAVTPTSAGPASLKPTAASTPCCAMACR